MESRLHRYAARAVAASEEAAHALAAALFPHFCLRCNKEGRLLCALCAAAVFASCEPPRLQRERRGLDASLSMASYAQPALRGLLRAWKYEGLSEAGEALCDLLATWLAAVSPPENAVVVPVPLHPCKRALRGFNQAEALAEVVARSLSLRVETRALSRRFAQKAQATIADAEIRSRNAEGKFLPGRSEAVRGKSVLLVDDVLTTGATAGECARALRGAGAERVFAITVLRG